MANTGCSDLHCTVVFGGPKLGKKSRTFQQISDTKSCGYVRNLVRFVVNEISFEGGGRWFSLFDRILVFGLNKESKAKFSSTFCHLQSFNNPYEGRIT